MARFVLFLVICGSLVSGCQSRMEMCAVISTPREPLVTLVDTTETKESPARACVLMPFPMPAFPQNLVLAGIEGAVVVRLTIAKDGTVHDSRVIKSSMKEFEEPSLVATKQWRFTEIVEPGVKERSGATVDCTIKFLFKEEEPNKAPEPTTMAVTPRASS